MLPFHRTTQSSRHTRLKALTACSAIAVSSWMLLGSPTAVAQSATAGSCVGERVIAGPAGALAVPSPLQATVAVTEPIPAGTYVVSGASHDSGHPVSDDQTAEQWRAVFTLSDGSTATTGLSPDLAREMVTSSFVFGEITLPSSVVSVVFTHGGDTLSANSIVALCVGFATRVAPTAPVPTKPEEPTPTNPSTTTASTTPAPTVPPTFQLIMPATTVAAAVPASAAPNTASATAAPITTTAPVPTTRPATTVAAAPAVVAVPEQPEVEVQGISVSQEAPLAYTGTTSNLMAAFAIALLLSGLLTLGRLGQTRVTRRR